MKKNLQFNLVIFTLTFILICCQYKSQSQTYAFSIKNTGSGKTGIYQTSTGINPFENLASGNKLVAITIKNNRFMVNTPDAVGGSSNFYFIDASSTIPDCNTDIIEITATTANIRSSASSLSANVLTNSGSKPGYGNLGDKFAFKSTTTNGSTVWYEIYLPDRWNQATGWVSKAAAKRYSSQSIALETSTLDDPPTNITETSCNLKWSKVTGSESYDLIWNIGSSDNETQTFKSKTGLSSSTNYNCKIVAKNSNGCSSENSNTIYFKTLDNATGSVNVTISPSGASTARWNLDGGAWETNNSKSGISAGSHTINFETIACWTTPPSQNISITKGNTTNVTGTYLNTGPSTPIISAQGGVTSFCLGAGSVTLQVNNACSGCTYKWSDNQSGTSININNAGSYSCKSTSPGCGESSVSNTIDITVKTAPTASFSKSGNACDYNFIDNSTGSPQTRNWNFGDPFSLDNTSTSLNPQHTFTGNKTYNVSLQSINECGDNSTNQQVTVTGCFASVNIINSVQYFEITPNPIIESARINFSLYRNSKISIKLFDLKGVEIAIISESYFPQGPHSIEFSKSPKLTPGTYILKFISEEFYETKRLVIL